MKVEWHRRGRSFELRLALHPEESLEGSGQLGARVRLNTDRCRIDLPDDVGDPHPDLLGLAAWTIVRPWVTQRMTFRNPVSATFAEALNQANGVDVTGIDNALKPRRAGNGIALSFSGGADSVALSEMIPRSAVGIHFQRVPHSRSLDLTQGFRPQDTARIVQRMGRRDREVRVVKSDLEFIVKPWPDVPEWPAMTVGCLLLADSIDAGAVAYGTTLESRFLSQGYGWNPRALEGEHWHRTFAAVGMPWLRATAGLTEVVTLRTALASDIGDLVRWCTNGTLQAPCRRCPKCVRKEILSAALEERPLNDELIRNADYAKGKNAGLLGEPPYYFQNVLEWALCRIPGVESSSLATLAKQVPGDPISTEWMEHYFSPALTFDVPTAHQQHVSEWVTQNPGWMTPEQELAVRTYSASG